MNTTMSFSEEQAMVLDSAQAFCRDNSPISAVRAQFNSKDGFDAELWKQQVALGWTGISIPEQYAGAGLGVAGLLPILESMGRHLMTGPLLSSTLAAQAILRGGSDAQCERWLPAIAEGCIASVAIAENEDWGRSRYETHVEKTGDTLYLTGKKQFVMETQSGDLLLVAAMYEGRATLLLLEGESLAAAEQHSHTLIDETRRAATLNFNRIAIAPEAILEGADARTIEEILILGAAFVGAEATGAAISALQLTVDYLKTRKQFGRLIGSYQALKHPAVDILNAVEGARSLLYHAASVCGDGPLDKDAETACRMLKAQACDALLLAGDRAVQFHGGMGFTHECDAQLYLRRALWAGQQFGDSLHQRKRLATLLFD
jgi:alkylation response protein AidB-like acyl-CoA dehydrogenase